MIESYFIVLTDNEFSPEFRALRKLLYIFSPRHYGVNLPNRLKERYTVEDLLFSDTLSSNKFTDKASNHYLAFYPDRYFSFISRNPYFDCSIFALSKYTA